MSKLNGSASTTSACGSNGRSAGQPASTVPSALLMVSSSAVTTAPNRPAHKLTAGCSSTSRLVPATATAAHPISVFGWHRDRTAAAAASGAPACGGVGNSTARSAPVPSFSSTSPATSPTACAVTGCSDSADANGTLSPPSLRFSGPFAANSAANGPQNAGSGSCRGQKGERDHGGRPLADPAVGLDGAELLVGQLAPDQAVGELAGLDVERLGVAGHLLAVLVPEHHCQDALAVLIGPAADEQDQVRRDRDRRGAGGGHREHDPGQVDPGRRPWRLAEVDVLGENRGNDVHRVEAIRRGPRRPIPARRSGRARG